MISEEKYQEAAAILEADVRRARQLGEFFSDCRNAVGSREAVSTVNEVNACGAIFVLKDAFDRAHEWFVGVDGEGSPLVIRRM